MAWQTNSHSSLKILHDLRDKSWSLCSPEDPLARHDRFDLNRYEKTSLIAEGRMGKVLRYVWRDKEPRLPDHPAEVAVKKVKYANDAQKVARQRELDVLKSLSHPNVIDLIATVFSDDRDLTVMKLYPMNLSQYVETTVTVGRVDVNVVRQLCKQLCEGMQYLHEFLHSDSIIHGDITPSNVMLELLASPRGTTTSQLVRELVNEPRLV